MSIDKASVLTRLAAAVAAADGSPLAVRLCRACLTLTGASAGAITLGYTGSERATVAATSPLADRLEDLQELVGEGPGWDAARTGVMVHGTLGAHLNVDDDRWPMFSSAAAEQTGPTEIYAFPMRPDGRRSLGVITLLQGGEQPAPVHLDGAQFTVDAVGAALLRDPGWTQDTDQDESWTGRARIHQATGMVVAQLAIPVDDALALLRAHAYAHATSLAVIAEEVVERRLDFSQIIERTDPS